jgi:hypothetical protein
MAWCVSVSGREHNTLSHRQKPSGGAVMRYLSPVKCGRRLKSQPEMVSRSGYRQNCDKGPHSRKETAPGGGAPRPLGSLCRGIDRSLNREAGNRSPVGGLSNQYRTTTTMAATSNAAISESARSMRLERGFAMSASSGGMTQTLNVGLLSAAPFRAGAEPQVGGFSSPASQPMTPDLRGSRDTTVV